MQQKEGRAQAPGPYRRSPALRMEVEQVGMATGISPSGNGFPSPSPRGQKFPVPVPANAHGGAFSPIPVPVGEFIPVGNPAGNLSPLEVQCLKINLN
jgi:hypothetical protein